MIELGVKLLSGGLWVTPRLWNKNLGKLSRCVMLFDTGASMTTIDTSIANRSGISLKNTEPVKVHGVGGTIKGNVATVSELWLGDMNVGSLAVNVIQFNKDSEVLAVLGMNVIKEFRVQIDLQKKSKGNDGTIFLEPTFDINDITNEKSFFPNYSRFGVWSLASRSAY